MALYVQAGRRSAALRQYASCRQVLAAKLDVEPSAETTRLYEHIKRGALEPEAVGLASGVSSPPALESPSGALDGGRFVGRDKELRQLHALLAAAQAGRSRAGFVTGEAGSGKTALLDEFVRRAHTGRVEPAVARGECTPYGAATPYGPFRELLEQLGDAEGPHGALTRALVEVGSGLLDTFVLGHWRSRAGNCRDDASVRVADATRSARRTKMRW